MTLTMESERLKSEIASRHELLARIDTETKIVERVKHLTISQPTLNKIIYWCYINIRVTLMSHIHAMTFSSTHKKFFRSFLTYNIISGQLIKGPKGECVGFHLIVYHHIISLFCNFVMYTMVG